MHRPRLLDVLLHHGYTIYHSPKHNHKVWFWLEVAKHFYLNTIYLNFNNWARQRGREGDASVSVAVCLEEDALVFTAGSQAWSVVSGGSQLEKSDVFVCFCVCLCASLFSVCVVFMSVCVCSALLAFSSIMSVYCTFLRLVATVPEVRAPLNDAESLCGHCWLIAPQEYDNTTAAVSKCRHNMRNTHPTVSTGSDSVSRHPQYVGWCQSVSRLFPRETFSVF